MNLRNALLMLLVLLALGGYVYFVDRPQQEEEAAGKKLFIVDKEAITEVVLTYADREIRLKKDSGKWRITQPVDAFADQETVNNLVTAIVDTEVRRTLEEIPQDLAIYGLTAPVVIVSVALKDGTTLPKVRVGKDTPVGFAVYVQKEGEPKILLTAQSFRLGMTKTTKDLRDKTILAVSDQQITQIALSSPDKDIVLNKGDTSWSLEKPVTEPADEAQVRTFLATLQGMRAQDFIEKPALPLSTLGLDPPQLTITLTTGTGTTPTRLFLGGEKTDDAGAKQRYLKRADGETLFLVADGVGQDLNKTASDFRDKTVARFDLGKAAKIAVARQDGENFTLTRGANKQWSIDKPSNGIPLPAKLEQFTGDLHQLRGFEIAAENPTDLDLYGLKTPVATITVSDEAGTTLATILLGQHVVGNIRNTFAMTASGNTVFALREHLFGRVNKKPADFSEPSAAKRAAPAASSSPQPGNENSEDDEEHIH